MEVVKTKHETLSVTSQPFDSLNWLHFDQFNEIGRNLLQMSLGSKKCYFFPFIFWGSIFYTWFGDSVANAKSGCLLMVTYNLRKWFYLCLLASIVNQLSTSGIQVHSSSNTLFVGLKIAQLCQVVKNSGIAKLDRWLDH